MIAVGLPGLAALASGYSPDRFCWYSAIAHLRHLWGMLIGMLLFALGTWLRIDEEERLLGAAPGLDYGAYA